MIAMAKTKTTAAKAANVREARKTRTKTTNGGGSNDPDLNDSDDNDDLFPSSGGDDDGGGGGDDSDNESFYDYNYMGRADMVALFGTLGLPTKGAATSSKISGRSELGDRRQGF
jgi:hypothetical protein